MGFFESEERLKEINEAYAALQSGETLRSVVTF